MSTRVEFENELNILHKDLIKMGTIIEESIDMTMEALKRKSTILAEKVIQRDDIVDVLESKIESDCILMIYRQQPVASDLRTITSVLKMITDLERISDNCSDISEFIIKIINENNNIYFDEIIDMAIQVKKMLKDTIDNYISCDYEKVIKTSQEDDIVDSYFEDITIKIQNAMKTDSNSIVSGTYFLFIIKYLERMADHITNICEWIAYRKTGIHDSYN